MSASQASMTQNQSITPPSSFVKPPLTPPLTDEKPSPQVERVLTLFKKIQDGKHSDQDPWTEIRLSRGDYDELKRQIRQNKALWGFTKDKIWHDYNDESQLLVVRMPSAVHELFIAHLEDAIFTRVKSIREGTGSTAAFAWKVQLGRSTEIYLPIEDASSTKNSSKYEPDASFLHEEA
ncbi:hypothetical protein B0J11DRAFT_190076 [Dendryphion nanum]|uniref:Uncharacterized protein n=1 Tax=Dendryphion nanum TaxID=256645 RepID=A0A9P9D3L3_9PLEO|nr:hypothetical protein B0J11DRAFT_190076 [Dendryphion nanum]